MASRVILNHRHPTLGSMSLTSKSCTITLPTFSSTGIPCHSVQWLLSALRLALLLFSESVCTECIAYAHAGLLVSRKLYARPTDKGVVSVMVLFFSSSSIAPLALPYNTPAQTVTRAPSACNRVTTLCLSTNASRKMIKNLLVFTRTRKEVAEMRLCAQMPV